MILSDVRFGLVRGIKYYSYKISFTGDGASSENTVMSLRDVDKLAGSGIPEIGDEIVRIGNATDTNRQGVYYITSNDNNAPYIDILDGVTSDAFTNKTKVRLGKLNGITSLNLVSYLIMVFILIMDISRMLRYLVKSM